MEKKLWNHIERVRGVAPLVHNITNFVVMNNTANALLAAGASPIMAHAHSEIEPMVGLCAATVINIGTLDEYWVESMLRAAREATRLGRPWVLDPVGVGATPYRDEVAAALLALRPTVIRGNGSEILSLARVAAAATGAGTGAAMAAGATKGVDSTAASIEAEDAACWLACEFGSVVCVSGATDIVVGPGGQQVYVHNGSPMMTRVTGLGCSASALIGAFIAGFRDEIWMSATAATAAATAAAAVTEAVVAATALMAVAGEIAAEIATGSGQRSGGGPGAGQGAGTGGGPGTLQVALLDKLWNLTEAEFAARLKIDVR